MMTLFKHDAKDYWLGLIDDRGIFVFDPSIQADGSSEYVLLYEVNQAWLVQIAKDLARRSLKPCRGNSPTELRAAVLAFLHRDELIAQRKEKERLTHEIAERAELERKHKEFLKSRGLTAHMVKMDHIHRRVTHCYCCAAPLDSERDWGCSVCRWILCGCGACGCGYQRSDEGREYNESDIPY
jgi:hypothetical protein